MRKDVPTETVHEPTRSNTKNLVLVRVISWIVSDVLGRLDQQLAIVS